MTVPQSAQKMPSLVASELNDPHRLDGHCLLTLELRGGCGANVTELPKELDDELDAAGGGGGGIATCDIL